MSVCAICTGEITGPIHREPLGRGDAMVAVCERCATETVPIVEGPHRGYHPRTSSVVLRKAISEARFLLGKDGKRR